MRSFPVHPEAAAAEYQSVLSKLRLLPFLVSTKKFTIMNTLLQGLELVYHLRITVVDCVTTSFIAVTRRHEEVTMVEF